MSIGPSNFPAAISAASGIQAKTAEGDRVRETQSANARREASVEIGEAAEGIGRAEEESAAEDGDPDGRQLWDLPSRKKQQQNEDTIESNPKPPRDPSGESGGILDVLG